MKKYLITGGYGLIGSNLANTLNGEITILSRTDTNQKRVTKKTKVVLKDLSEISALDVKDIDVIYHCASTVDNFNILTNPYLDFDTNVKGTIALLEVCKNLPKKPKIIYLSTFFVFGNEFERRKKALDERSHIEPLALYPISKVAAEFVLEFYAKLYKIPYLICRLTNVYGEHESFENRKKGSLNFLIMQAVKGQTIKMYKSGNYVRDYIHVDDVVSALIFLEKKAKNDRFLVGYGKSIEFKHILTFILKETNNKSTVESIPVPDFQKIVGVRNFRANTSKLTNLGWEPKIDYKTGLQRVITHYKSLI